MFMIVGGLIFCFLCLWASRGEGHEGNTGFGDFVWLITGIFGYVGYFLGGSLIWFVFEDDLYPFFPVGFLVILITGGCGFVGTNLAIYLQKELKKFSIYTEENEQAINLEKTDFTCLFARATCRCCIESCRLGNRNNQFTDCFFIINHKNLGRITHGYFHFLRQGLRQ